MKEPNCIKVERCRNRPSVTHIYKHYLVRSGRGGTLGHLYPEIIVVDTLSRQDGDGRRKRVSPYMNPNQRVMIYKITVRSKMQYASETSLGRLDVIQTRAVKIIAMPEASLSRNANQPLAKRREVGGLTLFHRMHQLYSIACYPVLQ